jgi:hypothetical protein
MMWALTWTAAVLWPLLTIVKMARECKREGR